MVGKTKTQTKVIPLAYQFNKESETNMGKAKCMNLKRLLESVLNTQKRKSSKIFMQIIKVACF